MFDNRLYENEWFNNMVDFLSWCNKEIKNCRPMGITPQSMYYTTGQAGFDAKYPTFEDAYRAYQAYQKHIEELMK